MNTTELLDSLINRALSEDDEKTRLALMALRDVHTTDQQVHAAEVKNLVKKIDELSYFLYGTPNK